MRSKFQVTTKMSFAIALALALTGCAGGETPTSESSGEVSRLSVENRDLPIQDGSASSSSVSAMATPALPTLTLVASVAPPTVNGAVLQANSVTSNLNNIYVSYNLAGSAAGGGIDVINVSLPAAPVLSSSLQFPTLDVNNVHYLGGSLYVAGNSSVDDAPARLQRFSTTLLGNINALVDDIPLLGHATTAVGHSLLGDTLFAATGDNSGLQLINASTHALGAHIAIADARDVSVSTAGNVYAVTGNDSNSEGFVKAYSAAGSLVGSLSLGNTGAAQSKSTINAGLNYAVATAGSGGFRLICLANLSAVASAAAPTNGVTNAAVFMGGFVFAADGADGVTVYSVDQGLPLLGALSCSNATLTKLGSINFGTSVSANNISVFGSYLIVSGGLGGFKLIRVTLPAFLTGVITSL